MNIVIISGSFYPSIHPRAFRATELAKEFSRQGHHVTAVFCSKVKDFDYDSYSKKYNIELIPMSVFTRNRMSEVAAQKRTTFFKIKRFLIEYLLCGNLLQYARKISQGLLSLDCFDKADLVIALSTPFPVHYGFYKFMKKRGKRFVAVADSGDPFYYSKQTPRAIWFKYIEKNIYELCDFITIPTANAIGQYSPICPKEKIKIIPQGFDMTNLNLYKGEFNNPVKFAYAGVFYWDIRNPEFLFKYLESINMDYEFHIFMRYADKTFLDTIEKYPNLKKKIKLRIKVPHDELVTELSKMHFLINIENLSNTQMPSKLIDYGMVKRPILSCNETNYKKEQLDAFLHGDYNGQYKVNVEDYDIRNIANKFLALLKE